jgi:hypothetical protein
VGRTLQGGRCALGQARSNLPAWNPTLLLLLADREPSLLSSNAGGPELNEEAWLGLSVIFPLLGCSQV